MISPLLLVLPALGLTDVDVTLSPAAQGVHMGCIAEVEVVLSSDGVGVASGLDLVFSWDPAQLELLQATPSAGPWLLTGFLNDPDDINDDLTDGDAIFTLLAPVQTPLVVSTPVVVVTLEFLVLDDGGVSLLPTLGLFAKTKVNGTAPGENVTGVISGPSSVDSLLVPSAEPIRLGVPPNPDVLSPGLTSGPVVGQTWDPFLDHTTFVPTSCLDLLALSVQPVNLFVPPYGTATCINAFYLLPGTPGMPFALFIPNDCTLIGGLICAQGVSFDCGSVIRLTNGIDFTIGNI